MTEALLRIRGVRKSFGGLRAVDGATLDVRKGGITGLIGPNGSGKTTLFNTVLGIYQPEEGSIYLDSERIDGLPPHVVYAKGLANAFQIPRLFRQLSVLDNMLLAARGNKGEGFLQGLLLKARWQRKEAELAEKALGILRLLELEGLALAPAGEISGGQMKLLEIGRALMADPMLVLLDEPAAGVNPVLGRKIYERIEELCSQGLSFFIIEHRLEILFDFANWVYLMEKGRVVAEGSPAEIVNSPVFYEVYLGE